MVVHLYKGHLPDRDYPSEYSKSKRQIVTERSRSKSKSKPKRTTGQTNTKIVIYSFSQTLHSLFHVLPKWSPLLSVTDIKTQIYILTIKYTTFSSVFCSHTHITETSSLQIDIADPFL